MRSNTYLFYFLPHLPYCRRIYLRFLRQHHLFHFFELIRLLESRFCIKFSKHNHPQQNKPPAHPRMPPQNCPCHDRTAAFQNLERGHGKHLQNKISPYKHHHTTNIKSVQVLLQNQERQNLPRLHPSGIATRCPNKKACSCRYPISEPVLHHTNTGHPIPPDLQPEK